MSKFSVGDQVRIVSERSVSYGDIGRVVNPLPGSLEVFVNGYTAQFLEHNLDKIIDKSDYDNNLSVDIQTTRTVDVHLEGKVADQFERLLNDLQRHPAWHDLNDIQRDHHNLITQLHQYLLQD